MAKGKGGFLGQDGLNAPDQATGVSGTAGDGQVTVSWTAPSDVGGADIEYYRVQGSDDTGVYAPDLANGSYASKSFSISSQLTSSGGLALKSDGTSFYVGDESSGVVYQYDMTTAFDLSTASYASKSVNTNTQTTGVAGLHFHPDGVKMYAVGAVSNDVVFQYALSTAWDVSTATYESKSFNFSSQNNEGVGLYIGSNGTKMFIAGNTGDIIYQYTLSTAYDVSTATYDSVSFDVTSEDSAPQSMTFNKKGDIMLIGGASNVAVFQYNLTTPFSLSTASYSGISLSAEGANPAGLAVADTNEVLLNCDPSTDTVYQYDVSQPTGTSAIVGGLTNGTEYTFNVWAINPFGWSSPSDASDAVSPYAPRALFGGGNTGSMSNVIDTVVITTLGNASDFGDLNYSAQNTYACSSVTRGIFAGGALPSPSVNNISYVTIGSTGSASDFGDLNNANTSGAGLSNSTRGIFAGGSTRRADIYYITIASTGNSSTFGSLNPAAENTASCASSTRGVWAGGNPSTGNNTISYVTIASTGDASDFGDLIVGRTVAGGASSATRALFGGAYSGSDYRSIEYVTIASTGNATDFGELTYDARGNRGTSSSTRALFMGGLSSNNIDYVTISTTGNAADFGDMTISAYNRSALSNDHGGLS